MKQVDKEAYNFHSYSHPDRWVSYYHQLDSVLADSPQNILEVGVGDGVMRDYLKNNTSIAYTSIDVAEDLHPDVVGSVTKMPFADASYDVVCAFEVLEHLPFEEFEKALSEIKRVSRGRVVISLPHFGPPIQFMLKVPFLRPIKIAVKIPYAQKHQFNGQHYWEIGKRGYAPSKIRAILEKYFTITKEFIPFESQYHHFFVLQKIS